MVFPLNTVWLKDGRGTLSPHRFTLKMVHLAGLEINMEIRSPAQMTPSSVLSNTGLSPDTYIIDYLCICWVNEQIRTYILLSFYIQIHWFKLKPPFQVKPVLELLRQQHRFLKLGARAPWSNGGRWPKGGDERVRCLYAFARMRIKVTIMVVIYIYICKINYIYIFKLYII